MDAASALDDRLLTAIGAPLMMAIPARIAAAWPAIEGMAASADKLLVELDIVCYDCFN
jgi:hypothetical protein